jgi:hypothetical protein
MGTLCFLTFCFLDVLQFGRTSSVHKMSCPQTEFLFSADFLFFSGHTVVLNFNGLAAVQWTASCLLLFVLDDLTTPGVKHPAFFFQQKFPDFVPLGSIKSICIIFHKSICFPVSRSSELCRNKLQVSLPVKILVRLGRLPGVHYYSSLLNGLLRY